MSEPVPLMRTSHLSDCQCYGCERKQEINGRNPEQNRLKRTNSVASIVLTIIPEEEITPVSIHKIKSDLEKK